MDLWKDSKEWNGHLENMLKFESNNIKINNITTFQFLKIEVEN